MARYPLGPLLAARCYREEEAARQLRAARRRLEEAREAEAALREKHSRYREWRPGEEERLFKAVRGRVMSRDDLDLHREDAQALRRTELELEEQCREAEKAVNARQDEENEAKRRQAAAIRDRRKIEAHRDVWRREEARRQIAAEEAELEDFAVRPEENADDVVGRED